MVYIFITSNYDFNSFLIYYVLGNDRKKAIHPLSDSSYRIARVSIPDLPDTLENRLLSKKLPLIPHRSIKLSSSEIEKIISVLPHYDETLGDTIDRRRYKIARQEWELFKRYSVQGKYEVIEKRKKLWN